MEKKLANYIEQFETILNFSDICWWIIDYKNDSGYYYCNELMEDTFMLDKSNEKHSVSQTCPIAGDYIKNVKFASTDQANLIIKEYLELLNLEKKEFNNKFPYHDIRTNEIYYFSSKAKVLETDEEGNPSIIYGIIENITNRETKSKELKEYHDIIDKYVMTSTTDTNGIMTSVSKSFCEKTGFSKEELIGSQYSILRHPDISTKIYKKIWRRLKSGQAWEGELKNIKKDGSMFWVENSISANLDEDGNIIGFTSIYYDITDKKEISELLITDFLTKIYNRRHFNTIFDLELKRSIRHKKTFVLMILDIDFFKQYNDTYGHDAGDKVLFNVAQTLKSTLKRSEDFVFRLGGEEFGIITSSINVDGLYILARKLRQSIQNLQIEHCQSKTNKYLSISIGMKLVEHDSFLCQNDIYKLADEALYKAKESGRNKAVLCTKNSLDDKI